MSDEKLDHAHRSKILEFLLAALTITWLRSLIPLRLSERVCALALS